MEEATIPRRGPIDGTGRILRELIRTPGFKKSVSALLSDLDPENTGMLIRTLVWEDPEFFLSLFGALPKVLNVLNEGLRELAVQLAVFPTATLADFLVDAMEEIDLETLGEGTALTLLVLLRAIEAGEGRIGEAAGNLGRGFASGMAKAASEEQGGGRNTSDLLLDTLVPMMSRAASRLGNEAAREGSETSKLVKGLVEGMRAVSKESPEFMQSMVVPLVEAGRQAIAGIEAAGEES